MHRLASIMITCLLVLSFCGITYATENHGNGLIPAKEFGAKKSKTSFVGSIIDEVYATTAPDSGQDYNPEAVKVFDYGTAIYFVLLYYNDFIGTNDIHTVVSNAAGQILFSRLYSYYTCIGYYYCYVYTSSLSPGVYKVDFIVLGSANMISPSGYWFIVQ